MIAKRIVRLFDQKYLLGAALGNVEHFSSTVVTPSASPSFNVNKQCQLHSTFDERFLIKLQAEYLFSKQPLFKLCTGAPSHHSPTTTDFSIKVKYIFLGR